MRFHPPGSPNLSQAEILDILGAGGGSDQYESVDSVANTVSETQPPQSETVHNERGIISDPGRADNSNNRDYRLELFRQEINRYNADSSPPFIVQLYDRDPYKNLGNYNSMSLAKTLRQLKIRVADTSNAGAEKIVLNFYSWQEANKFIEEEIPKINKNWIALIPNSSIFVGGIIHRIPEDFTEEDIWSGLEERDQLLIEKVEILKRKVIPDQGEETETEFINTGSVKIFSRNKLPTSVRLFETT